VSLATQWERIKARRDFAELPQDMIQQVMALFDRPQSWLTANALEQATAALMTPADLEVFFRIKLIESRKALRPSYQRYLESAFRESNHAERGALAFRLLQALHWYYAVRQQRRIEEAKIRVRTGILFMLSFVAFFFPTLFSEASEILFRTTTNPKSLYAMTALAAGWIGASFSMMLTLNQRLENMSLDPLKVMSRFGFLLTRIMIGIGGGLMVFYALQAGLVEGKFLPDLSNIARGLTIADHALLVIWCFVAGFSERFVPGLLARMEGPDKKASATVEPPLEPEIRPSLTPLAPSAPDAPRPAPAE
jgi:hypothetical protein